MSSINNSYNRPNSTYLCGRGGVWQKPCVNGPNPDGGCGGVAVCTPTKSGDRWNCRRSREDGGACELGPLPNGDCCLTQPACRPRRTLRVHRFRLSALVAIVVVALVGTFGITGAVYFGAEPPLRDAGQLSPKHSGVVADDSCSDCHSSHGDRPIAMLRAVFNPTATAGMTGKCLDCHTFPGEETSVHKAGTCNSCHAEHKGSDAALIKFEDGQCHACHKQKFSTFASSHPQFGDNYPHTRRTAINFDHNAHLDTHFQDERFVKSAPKDGCISCHNVGAAGKAVPVKSFEENCAACHQDQISSASLNLITVPEFEGNPFDAEVAEELCGVEASDEEYESVSTESLNVILAALSETDPENAEAVQEKIGSLLAAVAENGTSPIAKLLSEAGASSQRLLAGLNADLVKAGVCSWIANKEFEPIDEGLNRGWRAEELSITYTAGSHSDQVLKSWYDFVAEVEDDSLTGYLLKGDAPGTCVSCHSVNDTGAIEIAWKAGGRGSNKLHKYNHKPHLNVLGPGSQCGTCHQIDSTVDYGASFKQNDPSIFKSNFAPIKKATCVECHNEQIAGQDCRTCHEYHENVGFRAKMMFDKVKENESVASK